MIFTAETAMIHINKLISNYPDLATVRVDSQVVRLHGHIRVFRTHNDFTVNKTYTLDIVVPIDSSELPYVIDIDRIIRQDYHHYYTSSGKLCLATDSEMRIRFVDGFDLCEWMSEFVELYYFSYEYYERYCIFPFGERVHGISGIIQTYQDILGADDILQTFKLMRFIKQKEYRGHHKCPCGSKNTLRNCHGSAMMFVYQNTQVKEIMMNDLASLELLLKEEEDCEHHRKQGK